MSNIKAGSIGAATGVAAVKVTDTFAKEIGYGMTKGIDGLALVGNGGYELVANYGLYGLGSAAAIGGLGLSYRALSRIMPMLREYSQKITHSELGANIKAELLEEFQDNNSLIPGIEGLADDKLGKADLKLKTEFRKAQRTEMPSIVDIVREIRPSLASQLEATTVYPLSDD